jgi:hypothetical protein
VINVSDPAHPYEEGFYNTPDEAWGVAVSGNYGYVADWSGLRVVNVSDATHPYEEGFYEVPDEAWDAVISGNYAYVANDDCGLIILEFIGATEVEENINIVGELPTGYSLSQNYPNPFNAQTGVCYRIPEDGHVTLKIFNTLGQEVWSLVDGKQKAGEYAVFWDGRDARGQEVGSGLYFCQLKVDDFRRTIKMVLLR